MLTGFRCEKKETGKPLLDYVNVLKHNNKKYILGKNNKGTNKEPITSSLSPLGVIFTCAQSTTYLSDRIPILKSVLLPEIFLWGFMVVQRNLSFVKVYG